MKWHSIITASILVTALFPSFAPASSASEIRIGVVNTERIMRESAPAIRAQKKIEKEFSQRDQDLQKMAAQAKALQEQLEKEKSELAEADRRNKERDLASLNREYQRAQRQMREDLGLRQNDEFASIVERTNKVIQGIAEAEKFDLILQLQDSIYRSPRIDITDKVIKALADK